MARKKNQTRKPGPLVLDRKVGIQNISDLVDNLSAVLESGARIVVDANSVQSADIAALQVLVAFANASGSRSREVEWKHDEGALQEFAELAGLAGDLRLSEAAINAEDDNLCPVF